MSDTKKKKNAGKRLNVSSAVPPELKEFVGVVDSHFLDSGAFTLKVKALEYERQNPGKSYSDYFSLPDFWKYVDDYCAFVKQNRIAIDLFANVDVLPDGMGKPYPKLTHRNQKYIEDHHGITPVPVVHFGTSLKWLQFYIDEGYDLIGIGGLVGRTAQENCRQWIDRCFDLVCDTPDRTPKVKLHGFGVTVYELLIRYPWWSVDSTSWTKVGAYGGILVPHKRRGKFIYNEQPYLMKMSKDSPDAKMKGRHYLTMSKSEQAIVLEWLNHIGLPLGSVDEKGDLKEVGVLTHHAERRAANLHFFERMRLSLPEYPWPFNSKRRKGFGFV
jgi:hypothetical protein